PIFLDIFVGRRYPLTRPTTISLFSSLILLLFWQTNIFDIFVGWRYPLILALSRMNKNSLSVQ
ncbi:MAG: hypothetical protein O4753_12935, partial [Trichodesmium sp. St7_bin2_1]|nr:hypothetical protein [Trichodesmium sp. St7_bin2_1]